MRCKCGIWIHDELRECGRCALKRESFFCFGCGEPRDECICNEIEKQMDEDARIHEPWNY